MDQDFRKKIRQKRIRNVILIILAVAIGIGIIVSTKLEGPGKITNGNNTEEKNKEGYITITMEILCDNLSNNMDKLEDAALEKYIPKDGKILKKTEVQVKEDSTVFDALNKVCRENDIQLESTYTPIYESYYVEGINYLYEFDGGKLSGWMYNVNGEFPNYGCSAYKVKDGDEIQWAYTCDLGKDLGENAWGKAE